MSTQAFGPRGNTANISCSDVASVPVQIGSSTGGCYTYQFVNTGSKKAYVTAQVRPAAAVIASPGSPANGVPILPNEIVIYNMVPDAWVSAICESGETTNLLVTPGEGM